MIPPVGVAEASVMSSCKFPIQWHIFLTTYTGLKHLHMLHYSISSVAPVNGITK